LTNKETAVALMLATLVTVISLVADAPIDKPADPRGIPQAHIKAPWMFIGIQEMLKTLPPLPAGVGLPILFFFSAGALPFLPLRLRLLGGLTVLIFLSAYAYQILRGLFS
jgi:hypothetical protein